MTTYDVHLTTDATECVTVEAETVEAAIERAYDESRARLCHECGRDMSLGEFEATEVTRGNKTVWTADDGKK